MPHTPQAYLPPGFGETKKDDSDSDGEDKSHHDEKSVRSRNSDAEKYHKDHHHHHHHDRDETSSVSSSIVRVRRARGQSTRSNATSTATGHGRRRGTELTAARANARVQVGVESRQVTVGVLRVANWRLLVSQMDSDIVDLHARFLEAIQTALTENNGLVETFGGDEVVVTWGASGTCGDQVSGGVGAGLGGWGRGGLGGRPQGRVLDRSCAYIHSWLVAALNDFFHPEPKA